MGSMRNPVGPLPSSIYWRRRAVLASVVALIALLAVWAVSSGGGTSSTNGKGQDGPDPAASITPGPSGTGPAISQAPGGRTESGAGTAKNGEPSSGSGGGAGSGADSGSAAGAGGGAGAAGGAAAAQVPADSPLPTCSTSALQWEVKSAKNEYEAGEKPRLELIARNITGSTCKVDLGPRQAVVTILQAGTSKAVWSSADCPQGAGTAFFRVPAQGETRHTVEWDRKPSAADQCQTPPQGAAVPDTYVVEAKAPGLPVARTSFVLKPE
ncbi:hypothetical protein C0216_01985 [Streptomyces globosus]|uniref:DUF4232 domain-containing protein n=2 Tax=Streptomyces globosus TaxID=68209 RepID=A0A344TUQ1_9ACTN|nr:hypothetical protein [Streptomyces globosus]AXE22372.1 hypothetical protein C0216_01985 [Streptomyces globosus]